MTCKMICGTANDLYALDVNGTVFKYKRGDKEKGTFSCWVALTHRTKDNTGPRCGVTRTDDTHVLYCILPEGHDQAHEWEQRELFRDQPATNKTCDKTPGCQLLNGHPNNCARNTS